MGSSNVRGGLAGLLLFRDHGHRLIRGDRDAKPRQGSVGGVGVLHTRVTARDTPIPRAETVTAPDHGKTLATGCAGLLSGQG